MTRNGLNRQMTPDGSTASSFGGWLSEGSVGQMDANIYVTDLETDEILYMSPAAQKIFKVENPVGKVCWKVLQTGMESHCPHCPVRQLSLEDPLRSTCVWEARSNRDGHIHQNFDSLMRWTDGRIVHVQRFADLTEERRQFLEENVDELTGIMNWRAGQDVLAETLALYSGKTSSLSICKLGLNNLDKINHEYGQRAGDAQILAAVSALQCQLSTDDQMFRYAGDEFIAIFAGVNLDSAAKKMQLALKKLQTDAPYIFAEEEPFCFGTIEVSADRHMSQQEVLVAVDESLYTSKRMLRIHRAEKHLSQTVRLIEDDGAFSYNEAKLYDALLQSTDDYLYVCNMKTGVFHYSQAMVDEFSLPGQVVENAADVWGAHVHEHDKLTFLEANQEITDGRSDSHCVEYRAKNREGDWVWVRCRGHVERDENGDPELFAGFITNLGKKNNIDNLTGLFNRSEFETALKRMLVPPIRQSVMLMLFNIDDLKHINNLYDRAFGDGVIYILAQKVQLQLPPNASAYHINNDEFAVIIRNGSQDDGRKLFAAIQASVSYQQTYDGKKFYCTLSCGCAVAPRDGASYLELVKYASHALDYAKNHGKNRMEFFTAEVRAHLGRALELTELLRESLENDFAGFEVCYQPVFTAHRKVHGAEALARWSHPQVGSVSPEEFVPLLEKNGMILRVGRWIFTQAVQACAGFIRTNKDFVMCINLSRLQLEDSALMPLIERVLQENNVDPRHIVLELTESYLAANMQTLSALLVQMRTLGVRIAMDDFGTGYSSLSLLKNAPVDIVKIDRSFVSGIREDTFDSAFIHLMVELCRIIGIETYLEGVETESEFKITQSMEIDCFQGFLLGRPCPIAQFKQIYLQNPLP